MKNGNRQIKAVFNVALVVVALSTSVAMAAPKADLRDYSLRVRESSKVFEKMSKQAAGDRDLILQNKEFERMTEDFAISVADKTAIAQAIADGKTHLVQALYASLAARDLLANGEIETKNLDGGLLSLMKVASASGKARQLDRALGLTNAEMELASSALKKKTEYSIDMLSWSAADAETHVKVMVATAKIFKNEKITAEESLVKAIMEVTGVDKDGAMKIISNLKDCA